MTPLTPEQIEALAKRIEARAAKLRDADDWAGAAELEGLAEDICDGTFFEVQP